MGLYDNFNSSQNALNNLRQATAGAIAAQKIAQRDYEQAQAEADKWENRIKLALKAGRDDLAKEALFRRNLYRDRADKLRAIIEQHASHVTTIESNLNHWENRIY